MIISIKSTIAAAFLISKITALHVASKTSLLKKIFVFL
jgi:hypothetical protein